jgi:hypothetical protein
MKRRTWRVGPLCLFLANSAVVAIAPPRHLSGAKLPLTANVRRSTRRRLLAAGLGSLFSFPITVPLLSLGLSRALHCQAKLNEAPYRFGARRLVLLALGPGIYLRFDFIRQANGCRRVVSSSGPTSPMFFM